MEQEGLGASVNTVHIIRMVNHPPAGAPILLFLVGPRGSCRVSFRSVEVSTGAYCYDGRYFVTGLGLFYFPPLSAFVTFCDTHCILLKTPLTSLTMTQLEVLDSSV